MDKLDEILAYYEETFGINEPIDAIKKELITNNVIVRGDSFYCPIWNDQVNGWLLLAGTKSTADLWVLKEIVKLIKTGAPIFSYFNGNVDFLLKLSDRYGVKVVERNEDTAFISFNIKEQ